LSNPAPLFISLGSNCYVSWTLRKIGFQQASYPIDWVNSFRFDKLLDFIEAYDPATLREMQPSTIDVDRAVANRYYLPAYEIRLPHEHDVEPDITLDGISDKYTRRFERLRSDISLAAQVIFVRCVAHRCYDLKPESPDAYTPDLVRRAVDVLRHACGHDRFTLILLSEQPGLPVEPIDHVVRARLDLPFENVFFKLKATAPTMEDAADVFRESIEHLSRGAGSGDVAANLIAPFKIETATS
jgi:hypothetical protein